MQLTEDRIRLIVLEARQILGPRANPDLLKRVTKEVVRRLTLEADPDDDPGR